MAAGRIKEISGRDSSGDTIKAKLRDPLPLEWAEYKRSKFEYTAKSKTNTDMANYEARAQCEFFDLLCIDIQYSYWNSKGEKVEFSTSSPVPADELKVMSAAMKLPETLKSQMELVPGEFKQIAIERLFETVDDLQEEAKKK